MRVKLMRKTVFSANAAMSVCLVSMMVLSPLSVMAANKPQYLPPIAPEMDPSGFAQPVPVTSPSAAPSQSASNQYGNDDAGAITPMISSEPARTAQTNADERIKQMLRDALQKHSQGDVNGAKQLFKKVLSVDPRNADANYNLGAMAEDAGDLNAAQNFYKAASLANPGDGDVRDALNSVNQKLASKAQEQQQAMAIEKKNQLRGMASQAAAAYKAGQYDKAIAILQQIDAQAPNDPNVKYGLGQAYRGKGDMARAQQNLQAAAGLDPNNQLYRSTLAEAEKQSSSPRVANDPNAGLPSGMKDYGSGQQSQPGASPYTPQQYMPQQQIADNTPAGDITPFTDQGNPASGRLYGHAFGNGPRGITIGSGMGGLGSMGLSALAGTVGSMLMSGGASRMMGGGRNYSAYGYGGVPYQSRGTRLVRGAAIGGLSGAAMGAMTGGRNGAMRGAMMGGLFGMLSGF